MSQDPPWTHGTNLQPPKCYRSLHFNKFQYIATHVKFQRILYLDLPFVAIKMGQRSKCQNHGHIRLIVQGTNRGSRYGSNSTSSGSLLWSSKVPQQVFTDIEDFAWTAVKETCQRSRFRAMFRQRNWEPNIKRTVVWVKQLKAWNPSLTIPKMLPKHTIS